jgi:hypothetical protein
MNEGKPQPDPEPSTSDSVVSSDDPTLTEYDKEIADSFPASDPPSQP